MALPYWSPDTMQRTLLRITNSLLLLSFLLQLGSGLGHGALSHQQFELMHEGNGYLLSSLVCVHVYLNRAWIKSQLSSLRSSKKK